MMRPYSSFTATHTITHSRTDTGDTEGQPGEWPEWSEAVGVYDFWGCLRLSAAVYHQAFKDFKDVINNAELGLEALDFLQQTEPDWRRLWSYYSNHEPFTFNKERASRTVRRTCTVSITIDETIEFDQEEPS